MPPTARRPAMELGPDGLLGSLEDLQDLTLTERPVRRSLKTPEEIERLTVDEELNDIERAVYLLSCGQDVQGTSVFASLPHLTQQDPVETLRRVLPKAREVLHGAGLETQLTAAVSFLTILREESLSVQTYSRIFLPIILQHLEHRDAGVGNAWLETLLAVIETLPKDTVRREILSPLISKAQLSQTLRSRLMNCQILGRLANRFEAHTLKREILPLVRSLCQDVEHEVRSCMCRQLEMVARGVGVELTKSVVLPELTELARDEGGGVRLAAFETLVNLLPVFDTEDRSQTVLPLVKEFCDQCFQADESILVSFSLHLGKLCHGLDGILTPDQHLRFLEFYKRLCTLGFQRENGPDENQTPPGTLEREKRYVCVRKNCAYNFPAMVIFADPKKFHPELGSTFFRLCRDPEVPVRYAVALGFYEVSRLLDSGVCLIHPELVTLLQDESLEVLDALTERLPEILELVTSGGESTAQERKPSPVPDLIPALTTAERRAASSLRWRTHEKLLRKLACLPHVISSDQIYRRFLPRVLTVVTTNNVLPVQKAASRTLCIFLRYNRRREQRREVIQKIIEQLGQGRSCWNRLRFLDTCEFIIEIFSRSFFCQYFFLPVLELTHDPVANVRMKLCHLLPKVKSTLKSSTDKRLLQQLELCVRKLLCREKDKDVLALVKKTVVELDRMEVASMDTFQERFSEEDLSDQEKEREELLLLEMERLEKEKQQTNGRLSSDKAPEKKRRDSKTAASLAPNLSTVIVGISTPAPSTSREIKGSKLVRSQSFGSQALHPKSGHVDKCANQGFSTGYSPSLSGLGKNPSQSSTDVLSQIHDTPLPGTSQIADSTDMKNDSRRDPPRRKGSTVASHRQLTVTSDSVKCTPRS
ncbi:serine/threonine-protein phosphatase 4 regulatory subunit 4 isoform X3 [Tachyglossus aculeatus]|uniref:serine/threonine-protein phosphatase 4 regulatory subunit 4 isoform X3 n=2 Tax=Tachyglossus aculeatus TaxID=9261 RepID=UPI0018F53F23|nr:serine/threonine-protein phosphatase 4 regulatory subunit 4 isoform X3 [Tachyglossus aculeatus]